MTSPTSLRSLSRYLAPITMILRWWQAKAISKPCSNSLHSLARTSMLWGLLELCLELREAGERTLPFYEIPESAWELVGITLPPVFVDFGRTCPVRTGGFGIKSNECKGSQLHFHQLAQSVPISDKIFLSAR